MYEAKKVQKAGFLMTQLIINSLCRQDGNQNNLRNAAYEAIMEMMKNSPKVRFNFAYF